MSAAKWRAREILRRWLRRQRAAEERALADECALTARHRNELLGDLPMMSAPEGTLRVEIKTPLPLVVMKPCN